MRFPLEGSKKAMFHTKNAGAEAAMNSVMDIHKTCLYMVSYVFRVSVR